VRLEFDAKLKRRLGLWALAGVLLVAALLTYSLNSSSYDAASDWVRESPAVAQRIGFVESVNLDIWSGFRQQSSLGFDGVRTGTARLGVRVKGQRGTVVVDLVMSIDSSSGKWRVDRFRFVPD
jgi:hypothetical protein